MNAQFVEKDAVPNFDELQEKNTKMQNKKFDDINIQISVW